MSGASGSQSSGVIGRAVGHHLHEEMREGVQAFDAIIFIVNTPEAYRGYPSDASAQVPARPNAGNAAEEEIPNFLQQLQEVEPREVLARSGRKKTKLRERVEGHDGASPAPAGARRGGYGRGQRCQTSPR
eukprot:scaffold26794_cov129-Isochrysis_galbana.AAC.1